MYVILVLQNGLSKEEGVEGVEGRIGVQGSERVY